MLGAAARDRISPRTTRCTTGEAYQDVRLDGLVQMVQVS